MKLIIDIPKEVVKAIQNGEDYRYDIHTAIAQGIPYEERPHGEWIMQLHNCDGEFYTCSVCGRMIRVSPYVEDNETLKDYPYCHCGARMKGGAE